MVDIVNESVSPAVSYPDQSRQLSFARNRTVNHSLNESSPHNLNYQLSRTLINPFSPLTSYTVGPSFLVARLRLHCQWGCLPTTLFLFRGFSSRETRSCHRHVRRTLHMELHRFILLHRVLFFFVVAPARMGDGLNTIEVLILTDFPSEARIALTY